MNFDRRNVPYGADGGRPVRRQRNAHAVLAWNHARVGKIGQAFAWRFLEVHHDRYRAPSTPKPGHIALSPRRAVGFAGGVEFRFEEVASFNGSFSNGVKFMNIFLASPTDFVFFKIPAYLTSQATQKVDFNDGF